VGLAVLVQQGKTKNMTEKFDFNDVLIKPATVSNIDSRQVINPFQNGFLPLITAPMDTVISEENKPLYSSLKIRTCLPRGEKNHDGFESYSLQEIEEELKFRRLKPKGFYLIDIANGHMGKLVTITKRLKKLCLN
jgi:hypothetical protein